MAQDRKKRGMSRFNRKWVNQMAAFRSRCIRERRTLREVAWHLWRHHRYKFNW